MNPIKRSAREDKCRLNSCDSSANKPQPGLDEQLSSGVSNYLQKWKSDNVQLCHTAENKKSISAYDVQAKKLPMRFHYGA